MALGDWVLGVYGNTYRYVAQVLGKFRNAEAARAIWGVDENGNTWEFMYFLTKPLAVNRPVAALADELNQAYLGFSRIADDKVERLIRTYGSLDAFVNQRLVTTAPVYLLLRSNIGSKWQDEDAGSYHYGTTVPNYTKLAPGVEFVLDRKFPEGVRIIGQGRIGEVHPVPSTPGAGQHFRATFSMYHALKPQRVVTNDVQGQLHASRATTFNTRFGFSAKPCLTRSLNRRGLGSSRQTLRLMICELPFRRFERMTGRSRAPRMRLDRGTACTSGRPEQTEASWQQRRC
jgi:hypothetical protein